MRTTNRTRHSGTTRAATVTSTGDGRDHLVGEQATAAGLAAGRGEYIALCGHRVVAASLVVAPGPTCFDCETALQRLTTTSHHRRRLIPPLLRRSIRRTHSPAGAGGAHRARRA